MNLQWFSKNTVCINMQWGKFPSFQWLIHLLFESGARGGNIFSNEDQRFGGFYLK